MDRQPHPGPSGGGGKRPPPSTVSPPGIPKGKRPPPNHRPPETIIPGSTAPPSFADRLKGPERDAYMALNALFTSYGLASLAPKIFDYIKQGYGADTISLLLQNTVEYKHRFAGNDARAKAGLSVLSPADYLATEASYRQILAAAGMPKGFYDQTSDFTAWIGGDVSPTEIKDRVDLAVSATTQANTAFKDALQRMYGIDQAGVAAYFLDSARAEPLLKKQAAAASIGAAAIQRGFNLDRSAFEEFATEGVSADQAQQGFTYLADTYQTTANIAARYGEAWSQLEAERAVFEPGHTDTGANTGTAGVGETSAAKAKRLASQERAAFAGGQASSTTGLNAGFRAT